MFNTLPVILASSCSTRINLLKQLYLDIFPVTPSLIDETAQYKEDNINLIKRLVKLKLESIQDKIEKGYIICAYTIITVKRKILPKPQNNNEVRECLILLSGCRHRVYTSIIVAKKLNSQEITVKQKIVKTIVKFKNLSFNDINFYLNTKEGIGKIGGYSSSGIAEIFIKFIRGSISNLSGLPLLETRNLLISLGFNG